MAGQTFHDRLTAAKHTLSGQNLARAVCKATTEEIIGPKKKHLDYLIHCTNEQNVSVPELCNLLIERTQQSSWVIVFKALITAHHLMCHGNERFVSCMATSSCKFHLNTFVDKTATHGYEMSTFVRRYAKYLNVKAVSYRTMGADFCKMKRGKEEGVLRNMNTETLLRTLPFLQTQLDSLIEFDCNPDDLSNGVMNSCFMLLYRDLIQLFAVYNDGIINLFEKYFNMNKKHCREALDIYKKFIVVMDKVSDFLKVAESVGIDKGNIPDLTKAPASLLEEMESHLTFLEGKRSHTSTSITSGSSAPSRANSVQTAVAALNSTGSAFTSSIPPSDEINGLTFDESMRRAVEEEAAVMNLMKEQKMKEMAARRPVETSASKIPSPLPPPSSQPVSPPMKVKESSPSQQQLQSDASKQQTGSNSALDDLMAINPAAIQPQAFVQVPLNMYPVEGMVNQMIPPQGFVSDEAFRSAFTVPSDSMTLNAFGQVLQPQSSVSPPPSSPVSESKSSPTSTSKLISGDLDSSLQSLVQNLDINGGKKTAKPAGHQWGSPKPQVKTGGSNWSPTSVCMSNYAAPQPVQPVMGSAPFQTVGVVGAPMYGYQPAVSGVVPQQPYMVQGMWVAPPAGYGVMCQPVQNVAVVQPQAHMGMMVQPSPQRSLTEGAVNNQQGPSAAAGWPAAGRDPFGAL